MQHQQEFYNAISTLLGDTHKDKIGEVLGVLSSYIQNQLSLEDATLRFSAILCNADLLKKIEELLKTIKMVKQLYTQYQVPPPNQFNQSSQMPKFPQSSGFRRKSRPWSSEEDERLIEAVTKNGTDNWAQISEIVGGDRTRSQCSQRWNRVLNPKILKTNWSREEEQKLINAVNLYGIQAWTRVAAEMGNRSDVQCRFRYNFLLKKSIEKGSQVEPIATSQNVLDQAVPDPHLFTCEF